MTLKLTPKQEEMLNKREWLEKNTSDNFMKAGIYRSVLVKFLLYPTGKISEKPEHAQKELFNRAALHLMIDELPREDLQALYEFVRVLCSFPEGVDLGLEMAQANDADFRAKYNKAMQKERK